MTVLIAPDKFKGSLTAAEVVRHLGTGLERRGVRHLGLPLADGGDGSVAAALAAGFRPVEVEAAAATGQRRPAAHGLSAVHAIADRTDGDPATDAGLSARLLRELGRTMPLPGR
jgi:glycerate 2-kinase